MVNFRNLADKARDAVEKRGGTDALKEDAEQLKAIAKGPGSLSEKAKAAASALKDPGKAEPRDETKVAGEKSGKDQAGDNLGSPEQSTAATSKPSPRKAAGKAKTEAAAKQGKKAAHSDNPAEVGGSK